MTASCVNQKSRNDYEVRKVYICTANLLYKPNKYDFGGNFNSPNKFTYKINVNDSNIPILNTNTFKLLNNIIEFNIINSSIEKIEEFGYPSIIKAQFMRNKLTVLKNNSLLLPELKHLNLSRNLIDTIEKGALLGSKLETLDISWNQLKGLHGFPRAKNGLFSIIFFTYKK